MADQATRQLTHPALSAPVIVHYDAAGVPHIEAASQRDAYLAQGYVVAEARLFQLELLRRTAAGRLAECFGPPALAGDRFQRSLGLNHLAARKRPQLEPVVEDRLNAYAEGVNLYAAENPLPWELAVIGLDWQPWTLANTLVCCELRAVLNASWRADLMKLQVSSRAGAARAASLFPQSEFKDGEADANVVAGSAGLLSDWLRLANDSESALRLLGLEHTDIGTNTWCVSGERSASGKPLLANDLHMGFIAPNPNFLVHLRAPGLHIRGVCFPGVPGMLVGHNERIAWGSAAFMADSQDLFIVEMNAAQTTYRQGNDWRPLETHRESIVIRGGAPEAIDVRFTHHGPLVKVDGTYGLALRWERVDDPPGDPSFHGVNTASDWRSFREALSGYYIPPTDFTYADVDGNIGAQSAGRVPLRPQGDGSIPHVALDGGSDWRGYIPFEELPSSYQPANGFLVRANQNHPGWESKQFYSRRWHPPYRAHRAAQLLQATPRHDVESFAAMQQDRYSEYGRFLQPRIVAALDLAALSPLQQDAAALLRAWDGFLLPQSARAAVLKECSRILKARLLEPAIGLTLLSAYEKYWPESNLAVQGILERKEASWLPPGITTYAQLYRLSFEEAVAALVKRFGDDSETWSWGALHPARFTHPFDANAQFRETHGVREVPVGSDGECIFSSRGVADYISSQQVAMVEPQESRGANFGATARLILDLADLSRSSFLLNLGQAGDPTSPHAHDHLPLWRDGKTQVLAYTPEQVRAASVRALTLAPASSDTPA